MNSFEIVKNIKNDPIANRDFITVLARDQLPSNIKWPSSFIINTEKSSEPGEHWLAFYYDLDGKCEFFDPLGFSPKFYKLDKFLNLTSKKYLYNSTQLQGLFSKYCGYYCTLFIMMKSRNYNLNFFLKLFSFNTNVNDKIIELIIQEKFFD